MAIILNVLIMVIVCGKSVHVIIHENGSIGAQVVISIVAKMDVYISWLTIIPIRATIQIKSYLSALRLMDGFIKVQLFVRVAKKCVRLSLVLAIKTAISGTRHLRSTSIPETICNAMREQANFKWLYYFYLLKSFVCLVYRHFFISTLRNM